MKRVLIVLLVFVCLFQVPTTILAYENLTPSGIQLKELESYIDEYVDDYIGMSVAGASIVVVKDNKLVFSKGYGYADIENQIPMDPSTSVLEWGSVSKLFVWVAVMQLVEQGRLDLYEDIRKILPEGFLTKLTYDEPITMLDLMNHQAGFEDNLFDLGYESMDQVKTLEEGLKLAEPKQTYPPGEVVAYSNFSTSLAAYIIEQITEKEFYDYVSENILSKLGMEFTSPHLPVEENKEMLQAVTKGYELKGLGDFQESKPFYISMYPSGAMNGTAEDLAKFAMALMPNDQETSPLFEKNTTLNQMFSTSYSPTEGLPGIAHGFWEVDGKKRGYEHSGNTMAFSSNFHIVPEDQFAVIVLTNQEGEADLTYGLTKALTGESIFEPEQNMPHTSEVEGTYMPARKVGTGFLQIYYYLTPYEVKALNEDEIEVRAAGLRATYIQEEPYMYRYINGHPGFIPTEKIYFHVEDGEVRKVSVPFSDWLPMDRKGNWLIPHGVLFAISILFFIVSSIVIVIFSSIQWKKKRTVSSLTKWTRLLTVSGAVLSMNVLILLARMLVQYNRAYSEVIFQFWINYLFTFTALISIGLVIWHWKKDKITRSQGIFTFLSIINSFILIGLLVYWQFYY